MTVSNVTPNRNYPEPHATNELPFDVARIVAALRAVDTDVANLLVALLTKVDATALAAYQLLAERNAANGYAGLNSFGQVDVSVIPQAFGGGLKAQGNWNASSNVPAIPAAAEINRGWFYIVGVDGSTAIDGENDWKSGDWVVSSGVAWKKIDNTDRVASVAGRTGAITLEASDLTDNANLAKFNTSGSFTQPMTFSAGATFSVAYFDANFHIVMNGLSPSIVFDADDYLYFDRATNTAAYVIGGAIKGGVNSTGVFGNGAQLTGVIPPTYKSGQVAVQIDLSAPHSLGAVPTDFGAKLVAKNTTHGYDVGAEIAFSSYNGNSTNVGASVWATATHVGFRMGLSEVVVIFNKTTGASINVQPGNTDFDLVIWARR